MSKFLKKNNRGFTLVETLVAISIFTVSILGMMAVLSGSISDTRFAKQKLTATYLAQEGIEYIRNMRDTLVLYDTDPSNPAQHGWDAFRTKMNSCRAGNECGFDDLSPGPTSHIFSCSGNNCGLSGNYSGFVRKIWTEQGANEVKIFSETSWKQDSGDYKVTFSENLFNWIQ